MAITQKTVQVERMSKAIFHAIKTWNSSLQKKNFTQLCTTTFIEIYSIQCFWEVGCQCPLPRVAVATANPSVIVVSHIGAEARAGTICWRFWQKLLCLNRVKDGSRATGEVQHINTSSFARNYLSLCDISVAFKSYKKISCRIVAQSSKTAVAGRRDLKPSKPLELDA